MLPKPLAVAIVCLVTIVWLANFAAQFAVPGYAVDGWVHSIFLTVVGGALAISRKGGGGRSDDDPDGGLGAGDPGCPVADPSPPPPEPPRRGGSHRAPFTALTPRRWAT